MLRTHFIRRFSQVNVQILLQETSIENNDIINLTNITNIQNIIEETVAERLPCDNENIENICLKLLTSLLFFIILYFCI